MLVRGGTRGLLCQKTSVSYRMSNSMPSAYYWSHYSNRDMALLPRLWLYKCVHMSGVGSWLCVTLMGFIFLHLFHLKSFPTLGSLFFLNPCLRICLLIWKGKREREKYWLVASGTCPKQGLNWKPFSVWNDAPTNWATQPGPLSSLFILVLPNMGHLHVVIASVVLELRSN